MTQQFFETNGSQGNFFEKNKNPGFIYGLGEGVYQISDLSRFSFGHEVAYASRQFAFRPDQQIDQHIRK